MARSGLSSPRGARLAVVMLGAATAALQTLAVREGLAVMSGNEAVVALLFGVWLVTTALGARLGRVVFVGHVGATSVALGMYALLVPLTLVAARAVSRWLPTGVAPSLVASFGTSIVLLTPACVLAGWIYSRLADRLASALTSAPRLEQEREMAAKAYWLDTLGAGLAGAVLALFVLDHVLPFRIAALASAVACLGAAWLLTGLGQKLLLVGGLVFSSILWILPWDHITYPWQIPGQNLQQVHTTARGALLVTESAGQQQLVLQREPVMTTADPALAEQIAHLSLGLHPNPRRVAVLGVVPARTFSRFKAHGVQRIDCVLGDPSLVAAIRELDPDARDDAVHLSEVDERQWARSCHAQTYDVAIVTSGAPTSVAEARLFSSEFYFDVQRALRPNGVLVVTMPGHASFASDEQRRMHSAVASTLRTVFSQVVVLPAESTFYVASRAELPALDTLASQIENRLESRAVQRNFLSPLWLSDTFSHQRLTEAHQWASLSVPASTDDHPIVYRLALDATLSELGEGGVEVLFALALFLAAVGVIWFNPRSRPVSFSVATTGFAGLSLQLVLMLVHQTAVGALYRDIALITAAFMAASCAGTWWASRYEFSTRRIVGFDAIQIVVAIMLALTLTSMVSWHGALARISVVIGALCVGASTGAHFALAARAPHGFQTGVGGAVYAVDLSGAALAALIIYTWAVPWLGLVGTALAVGGIKVISTLALLAPRSSEKRAPTTLRVPGPALALVVLMVLGLVESTQRVIYGVSVSRPFCLIVLVVLALTLVMAFEPRWLHQHLVSLERSVRVWRSSVGLTPLRFVTFLVLLPVAVLPIVRCYFKIPYLFCHVCPRPCVFGVLRPYVVVAALIANLGDRRFCERACPLGSAQSSCESSRGRRGRRTGRLGFAVRGAVLIAVAVLYPVMLGEREKDLEGGLYAWFYLNSYTISTWVLGVAGLVIALSFFWKRPFCEVLCPIGAVSDLVWRIERRVLPTRKSESGAKSDRETQ